MEVQKNSPKRDVYAEAYLHSQEEGLKAAFEKYGVKNLEDLQTKIKESLTERQVRQGPEKLKVAPDVKVNPENTHIEKLRAGLQELMNPVTEQKMSEAQSLQGRVSRTA